MLQNNSLNTRYTIYRYPILHLIKINYIENLIDLRTKYSFNNVFYKLF